MKDDTRRREVFEEHEREIGATSGRTHRQVIEQTIGRDRAIRAVTNGGPDARAARRRRDPAPALDEES